MKQTESAVRMLISAYKAVLTNCYIKENLLGGGKRLVKGAALSSFLTAVFAGISSPSFAVELESPIVVNDKVISTDQLNDYGLTQNNEIYGNLQISPEDQNEPAIEGEDSSIEIHVQGNSEKGYNGDFAIEAGKESHGIISKLEKDKEINLSADGNLTIDVKGDDTKDHGDGINVTGENKGSITLNANQNIEINAKSKRGDGLLVSKGSAGDIKLTATTGNNKIIAGNNGIDHHGSQSITLEAREANIITAGVHDENQGKEGDGIRIEGVGSVTVEANYNQILAQDVGLYIDELVAADNKETSGNITLTAREKDAEGNGNVVLGESYGIHNSGKKDKNTEGATISVTAEIGNNVITGGASAVYNHGSGDILIQAGSFDNDGISLLADYDNPNNILIGRGDGTLGQVSGNGIASDSTGKTTVIARGYNNVYGSENGIYSTNGTIDVTAGTNNIIGQYADKKGIIHTSKVGINVEAGTVNISSTLGENEIFASEKGISIAGENSSVSLNGSSNLIRVDGVGNIQSSTYGILTDAGKFTVNNEQDNKNAITNIIVNSSTGESYGINARNGGTADIYTKSIEFIVSSGFAGDETDPSPDPAESGNAYGIIAQNSVMNQTSTINISADDFININVKTRAHGAIGVGSYGIYADTSSEVNFDANTDNLISVDEEAEDKKTQRGYGNGYAVYSRNASSVTIEAGNDNQLLGAVYAHGSGTNVFIGGSEEDEDQAARENRIYSYAYISGAGDLGDDPEGAFEGKNVISALYAEGGANIELSGISNDLRTYAEYQNEDQLERVVWAYNGEVGEENAKGTSISIKGYSYISTNQYDKSPNSLDIAIAAGTAVGLDEDDVNTPINLEDRAKVELTYADLVNEDGSTRHSFISGDILSAYDGLVNINPKDDSNAGINIEGNLLAGNNGIVNVDLGNGGTLTGRADDYGDAGVESLNGGHQNMSFFDPAFSSKIYSGGEVNLTMGEGSRWNVTRQSWITRIEASDAAISADTPIIDLITANTDINTNAHALTVYKLKGNAVFNMSLDGDRSTSDMLYIKNAQGEYTINVKDAVTVADMYANKHTGLRFATLGAGSHASFRAITWDGGINNIEYEVDTDDYDTSTENTAYNGEMLSADKPGDDTVDTFFGSDGEPGSTTPAENEDENIETQNLAANVKLAKAVVENAEIETTAASDTLNTDATNYKLVAVKSSEISDGGKTVIDMSRANYANAVYMDTLNKRQGEARFVGDTDHGVWVRLRHDNIGKDDSFRTHNTMVEVGFEQRDVNDYGEFHTGFALDYMNGQIDYHTVDGDGDIERYGVWFYTTYLGNDGQYADLVLKYGHLKNDFGFNTRSQGEHVTGDYTNEVASISAEYGWKFSNSYNYYIEPQVQLQYSYVTGADYTTSQGSKVELDSIHSLIGRVGFRAGKDFNTETPITAYIRGDVLHEFLGDQDIYAYDNTGVMDVTYENDDTWYSAGVGLSVQSSENTYFFIEGEQVFGADNDSTYTVSGGFKHSF